MSSFFNHQLMSSSENEISYRAFVQRFAKTDELSSDDYDALETYRAYLKLLPTQARRIEQEVLGSQPSRSPIARSTLDATPSVAPLNSEQPQFANTQADVSAPSAGAGETENSSAQPRSASGSDQNLAQSNQPMGRGSSAAPFSQPHLSQAVPTATPESIAMGTTIIPSKLPEQYFAARQQYGQEFLQVLRSAEGFYPGVETRERLKKLADELQLSDSDAREIELAKFAEFCSANPSIPEPAVGVTTVETTPTAESASPADPNPEEYNPDLRPLFEELEGSLKSKELKLADLKTFEILLEVIRPSQDWLDEESLLKFSTPSNADKYAIQEIDRLWYECDNKFGFSQQLQLYSFGSVPTSDKDLDKQRQEQRRLALAFSRSAQWWIDGLEFFKYYNQLDFTTEAPKAHLPAQWFWRIPRSKAFQYGGLGFLKERGGCRVDAYTLPAFMYVLKKCDIKPR